MNSFKNKWLAFLVVCSAVLGTGISAEQTKQEKSQGYLDLQKKMLFSSENVAKRVAPVGQVFVEGDDVPVAETAPEPSHEISARSGADVYSASCAMCHNGGLPNAPAFGSSIWAELGQRGVDDLLRSAISGTANGMPPKGGCFNCSDDELKAAIEHLVSSAQ